MLVCFSDGNSGGVTTFADSYWRSNELEINYKLKMLYK